MNLISKKELLALTGISYGQLYRWKREKLIPEQWFIKQSSYTGQETFFPREQILSRVRTILESKDKYSLEELAGIFSPETAPAFLPAARLEEVEEIRPCVREALRALRPGESYQLPDLTLAAAISACAGALELEDGAAAGLLQRALGSTDAVLFVLRVDGALHAALAAPPGRVAFDGGLEPIYTCPLGELANRLKLRYRANL